MRATSVRPPPGVRRSLNVTCLVAVAQALGRSPAAFLVNTPETAIIVKQIDGHVERCMRVDMVLNALDGTVIHPFPEPI